MNNKTPIEQYHADVKKNKKELKLILVVISLALAFYFSNEPITQSEKIGTISHCEDYWFMKEMTKRLTVKTSSNETINIKYYKCEIGQSVSVIHQKRLITRQNVYQVKYI